VNELNGERNPAESAGEIDRLIEELADQGASAVLLACTELGLVFDTNDSAIISRALPAYDTAILHALAAIEDALG
jgi:aspartate/glutamate racemase